LKPNITTVFNAATKFTENSVVDSDGKEHKGNAIICATGFDVSFTCIPHTAACDIRTIRLMDRRRLCGLEVPYTSRISWVSSVASIMISNKLAPIVISSLEMASCREMQITRISPTTCERMVEPKHVNVRVPQNLPLPILRCCKALRSARLFKEPCTIMPLVEVKARQSIILIKACSYRRLLYYSPLYTWISFTATGIITNWPCEIIFSI
jgi:hypothetical protein